MTVPRLSVIVATHNRPRLLEQAVASVSGQSFADYEIVIVDDASTAETGEVIARMASRNPKIRGLRSNENLGPAGARNLGIAAAGGELVAILDDDDLCVPHRFAKQLEVFEQYPDTELVCSTVQWIDRYGEALAVWPGVLKRDALPQASGDVFRLLYLENNKIPNTTIMARTSVLRRFPYAEMLWVGEDWYACMQMAASGVRMRGIAEPLVLTRRDSSHESLMASKARAFEDQRKALVAIRQWLEDQGIRDFDSLHRRAWSNQLAREGDFWSRFQGLRLALQAIAHSPSNGAAWSCSGKILRKAARRVLRPAVSRVLRR